MAFLRRRQSLFLGALIGLVVFVVAFYIPDKRITKGLSKCFGGVMNSSKTSFYLVFKITGD